MNKDALFCDGTSSYVIPAEPDEYEKVKLKFRTAKDDADEVCILTKTGGYKMCIRDSGSIRWFFILGVVCGIVLANFILSIAKKIYGKMKKSLEKRKKNR